MRRWPLESFVDAVEHGDAALVHAIDRYLERAESRPGHVDLHLGELAVVDRQRRLGRRAIARDAHDDGALARRRRDRDVPCFQPSAWQSSRRATTPAWPSTRQPISAATARPAAPKPEDRLLPELFRLFGPRFRDARRVQQTQARVHLLGQPELFDELRTRADQSFEIGDALGRQTAGEITLDDLVLDDEFTIHGRRRRARRQQPKRQAPGSHQRIRYDSQLPSWFKVPQIQSQTDRRAIAAKRTRRKNARRHSGWYLPLVLQDRTRLCCDSYVRKPLRRFTFHATGSRRILRRGSQFVAPTRLRPLPHCNR